MPFAAANASFLSPFGMSAAGQTLGVITTTNIAPAASPITNGPEGLVTTYDGHMRYMDREISMTSVAAVVTSDVSHPIAVNTSMKSPVAASKSAKGTRW